MRKPASAVMCSLHGGCWAASHPLPQHSADDSSPSLTLASCLLAVWGGGKHKNISLFLFSFYLHTATSIYSPLLGLGNLCPLASQSMDVHPSSLPYFLLPASRWRCSAYKQLTASTILWSHDLGRYQIRAITCYSSSLPQQLPQASATEWGL